MKKVLVFGGNGFLGSFVVRELCRKNYEVLVVSRTDKNHETIKLNGFLGQIEFKICNVAELHSLDCFDFTKYELVINLAGIGSELGGNFYHELHIEFPSRLACQLRRNGIKLIHVSAFTGENNTNSKYIMSKRKGELAVLQNDPRAIIIRPSMMIGEGGTVIKDFEKVVNLSPLIPLSGGNYKIQPVFVGDVAKFIVLASERVDMQGKSFNLLGQEIITLKEFIQRICGFMNKRRTIIPIPFFITSFILRIKEFLPSFIFRIGITYDIFSLLNQNLVSKKNDLPILISKQEKIDNILKGLLEKYRLYD